MLLKLHEIFGVRPHKIKKFKSYMAQHGSEPINRILDDIELLNKDKKDLNFSNRLIYEM